VRQAGRLVVTLAGGGDRGTRFHPVDREIVVGVRKAGPRFAGAGRLAARLIGFPRDRLDVVDLRAQPLEGGIGEPVQVATAEFLAREIRIGHPASRRDVVFILG
jgi:hypothetical protein